MGLVHRFKQALAAFRNDSLAHPSPELLEAFLGGLSSLAGTRVTPLKALGVSTVFACVNRVSGTIAAVPFKLCQLKGKVNRLAVEHPLYGLAHDSPTPEMTSVQFRRAMQVTLSLRSAAHALIVRNGLGEVAEIRPILPQDLTYQREVLDGPVVYRIRGSPVPASSLLPLRGLTVDGVFPLSVVSVAREAIGLAIVLQDNASLFFANGSRLSGHLEHPTSLSTPAAERLRLNFEKHHRGSANAWGVAVLEEGLKWVAESTNYKDSQFVEARAAQDAAICRYFGVPQIKAGITTDAHFNNVEQENQNYINDAILPVVAEWEQSYDLHLLTPRERTDGYYFRLVLQGLLRGALLDRSNAYRVALGRAGEPAWMTVNEVRALEELDPIDGGDEIKPVVAIPPRLPGPAPAPPPAPA
jgi:HK97 family phage portal protein